MKAILKRTDYEEKQTLGNLTLFDGDKELFKCFTLELPDLDNKSRVSCIPKGEYDVVFRTSEKYKKHFHVTDVPGRSYILIHPGNYHTQILGCILPGKSLVDINNDGYRDVTSSKATLNELLELAPDGFKLIIE